MSKVEKAFNRWCLASELFGAGSQAETIAWRKFIQALERDELRKIQKSGKGA